MLREVKASLYTEFFGWNYAFPPEQFYIKWIFTLYSLFLLKS